MDDRYDDDVLPILYPGNQIIWTPKGWELTVHLVNEDDSELLIFEKE